MRQKSVPTKELADQVIKGIRRATRRYFSAENKIRIVLEGQWGEASIAELCRREGIVAGMSRLISAAKLLWALAILAAVAASVIAYIISGSKR